MNDTAFDGTRRKAQAIINKLAVYPDKLRYTEHALERMKERDISARMVLRALRGGTVNDEPVKGRYPDELRCRIGEYGVQVVVAFNSESASHLLIISEMKKGTNDD